MARSIMLLALMIFASSVYPIGLQHGTFRSQSTQGPAWTGDAVITDEKMHVTVYRNYLDVELEWVFTANGVAPACYADALEIVGNVNLERGSVVVGMLVWYKDKILKAKIQRKSKAREAYEEVVDRDSPVPPRPRDPVILEYLGNDNYDISIFPVTFQGTRRLRMRYLVPASEQKGIVRAGFPHAFTITGVVTISRGDQVQGFSLVYPGSSSFINDSITVSKVQAYTSTAPSALLPGIAQSGNKTVLHVSATNNLFMPGEFVHVDNFAVSHIIDSVKTLFTQLGTRNVPGTLSVCAGIGNGAVSCSTGVTMNVNNVLQMDTTVWWGKSLCVYSRTPVKPEIIWQVFFNGELFLKTIEQPVLCTSSSPAVESKLLAASQKILSLEGVLPKSMAATFGFVDTAFALLALEKDFLPDQTAHLFEKSGVPLCNEEDIFADSSDVLLIPAAGLYDPNYILFPVTAVFPAGLHKKTNGLFDFIQCRFINGNLVIRLDYAFYDGRSPFEIAVYLPDGTRLVQWQKSGIGNARTVEWSPRKHGIASRTIIVRVTVGSTVQAKALTLM